MRQQHGLKILYLVHRVPFPPDKGDRIRSFHLLKFLAARAEVDLACLADERVPDAAQGTLEAVCRRVAVCSLGPRTRWLRAIGSLAAGRTATEGLFYSRKLKQTIGRWRRETRYDAVLAFSSSMVQYLDDGDVDHRAITIVDLVDVDSQKFFDYGEGARGLKRFLYRLEGRRLRRLERSLAGNVEAVTLVSEPEAELYKAIAPGSAVQAISNGVNFDYFSPRAEAEDSAGSTCVFVGALDYRANVEGVGWFCTEVWPEVLQRRTGALLANLRGMKNGPELRREAHSGTKSPRNFMGARVPLARGERFDGHEAVVLVERREADRAAPREVGHELLFVDPAEQLHAMVHAERDGEGSQPRAVLAFARDDQSRGAGLGPRHGAQHQIDALERHQARDEEQVVAEPVAPVGALRRRRVDHVRLQASPAVEPGLDVARLREQSRHVPRQQVVVGHVDHAAARALLDPSLPRQRGLEPVPLVVVLAHPVVQPADVPLVAHGVAREAKADQHVGRPAVAGPADVGEPVGEVGDALPPESVLRRQHEPRLVPGLLERAHERPRDDQVATFGERGGRRHNDDACHGTRGNSSAPRPRTPVRGAP